MFFWLASWRWMIKMPRSGSFPRYDVSVFWPFIFNNIFVGETKSAPAHPHFCNSRFPWSGTVPYVCLDFGVADPDPHRTTLLCCGFVGFVTYYFLKVNFMSLEDKKS
jgi:hypothetical protein